MFIETIERTPLLDAAEIARQLGAARGEGATPPGRRAVRTFVGRLSSLLLAPHRSGGVDRLATKLERLERRLAELIRRAGAAAGEVETARSSRWAAARLIDALPALCAALDDDVRAAYQGDPAAGSELEVRSCYPGLRAIAVHRLAHELHQLGVPLLPRLMAEIAHAATGIDIHPGARIGRSFFIDHGTGVVIGATCVIGARVRIYQGVTLGARSFPVGEDGSLVKGLARHPIIGDDVVIYGGACILGRVTIGAGSVIGGNVWLTRDIPAGSRILQAAERTRRFANGDGI